MSESFSFPGQAEMESKIHNNTLELTMDFPIGDMFQTGNDLNNFYFALFMRGAKDKIARFPIVGTKSGKIYMLAGTPDIPEHPTRTVTHTDLLTALKLKEEDILFTTSFDSSVYNPPTDYPYVEMDVTIHNEQEKRYLLMGLGSDDLSRPGIVGKRNFKNGLDAMEKIVGSDREGLTLHHPDKY